MNTKTNCLGATHGLEPGEVQLYRLLRLMIAPKTHAFMNSVSCKEMFKEHQNYKNLLGLQTKGYVRLVTTDLNAQVLEIIK